jgi:hypothetical protein
LDLLPFPMIYNSYIVLHYFTLYSAFLKVCINKDAEFISVSWIVFQDSTSKEMELLKEQVSDLRERLKLSSVQHSEEVDQLQVKLDGYSRSMLAQADAHKAEVCQSPSQIFMLGFL